ncbi:peptidylprolyl isomerase [Synechococcus sp. O70.2]|uniref:peptidylprolyl isomerase n=1 Tax=Synechococcus sp. O70.2 TaxID=2964533 RepID=UPI0039C42F36
MPARWFWSFSCKKLPLLSASSFWANAHFYDGFIFQRGIRGFMAQGGDPTGTKRGRRLPLSQ